MADIVRTGNRLDITGSARLPHGNELDFSEYPDNRIASVAIGFVPMRGGDYYAEALVDDSLVQVSLPHYLDASGDAVFQFIPPLRGGQVYGLKYFRIEDGQRYNLTVDGVIKKGVQ